MAGADRIITAGAGELTRLASNGKAASRNIALESLGFTVAEGVSMGTALGVVAVADQVLPPALLDASSKLLARIVIQPLLDPIEAGLGKVCKLKECQRDTSISRQERAEQLAKTLIVFGLSYVASFAAKLHTRRMMNKTFDIPTDALPHTKPWELWKLSRREGFILGADEGVHYGSLILANTLAAETTDDFIRATTNVLVKCGVPEKKAHELAAYTMVWEMPNFLGLVAGLGAIHTAHKHPDMFGIKSHH